MRRIIISIVGMLLITSSIQAQNQLAATLEVLSPVVEVQRVGTTNPIEVSVEAIVGVGDTIFTGDEGRARITFFSDGTTTELAPNTEYRIEEFSSGTNDSFQLRVSVLVGQTIQQLGRVLDVNSIYEIDTPGMTLAARGTVFDIRVEDGGRAGMLVREGEVQANAGSADETVPPEFGIRSAPDDELSDVVRASTFEELDAALDGCTITISTPDDVSLNVRAGPSAEADLLGFVPAAAIDIAFGINGNWYRIEFGDQFGWVLASNAQVNDGCAGLREFNADYRETIVIDAPLVPDIYDRAEPSLEVTPEVTEPATDS